MCRAVWNGVVLAETDRTVRLEGTHYFPPESLNRAYFRDSATKTVCPWKGFWNGVLVEQVGEQQRALRGPGGSGPRAALRGLFGG